MAERIDFWRGFAGGFLAGIAIGTFSYLLPKLQEEKALSENHIDPGRVDRISLHRDSSESAGDPSTLIPERGVLDKLDFERADIA